MWGRRELIGSARSRNWFLGKVGWRIGFYQSFGKGGYSIRFVEAGDTQIMLDTFSTLRAWAFGGWYHQQSREVTKEVSPHSWLAWGASRRNLVGFVTYKSYHWYNRVVTSSAVGLKDSSGEVLDSLGYFWYVDYLRQNWNDDVFNLRHGKYYWSVWTKSEWCITKSPQSRRISGEAIHKKWMEIYHDTKRMQPRKAKRKGETIHLKSFPFKDIALLQLHSCQEWCQKSGTRNCNNAIPKQKKLRSSGIGKIYGTSSNND